VHDGEMVFLFEFFVSAFEVVLDLDEEVDFLFEFGCLLVE
jgi:hypothetical protein